MITKDNFDNIISSISSLDDIELASIPNIDLYMDQVTTFMENSLKNYKRSDDDKIITKTMINNYSKSKILPKPIKKKYSKSHLILMIYIYYMKQVLPISDIEKIFSLIDFEDVEKIYESYEDFLDIKETEIAKALNGFKSSIDNLDTMNVDESQLHNIIMSLIIQSYIQKLLAERLIDKIVTNKNNNDDEQKEGVAK